MNCYGVKKVLSIKKLDYEYNERPNIDELKDLLNQSYKKLFEKNKELEFSSPTNVLIKYDSNKICNLSMNNNILHFCDLSDMHEDNYILMGLDNRLLHLILKGPKYAHWNNAEIGSHINFYRRPDVYERGLFNSLCYLHS